MTFERRVGPAHGSRRWESIRLRRAGGAAAGRGCAARSRAALQRRARRRWSARRRADCRGTVARRGRVRAALLGPVSSLVRRAVRRRPRSASSSSRAAARRPGIGRLRRGTSTSSTRSAPETFREQHDARVADLGEQKQTRVSAFDRELIDAAMRRAHVSPTGRCCTRRACTTLLNPYWWGHQSIDWVHRARAVRAAARACRRPAFLDLPAPYVAVKFYFNDCFPADDAESRVRARRAPRRSRRAVRSWRSRQD